MGDHVTVTPREQLMKRRSPALAGASTSQTDTKLVAAADVNKQRYASPFDASLAAARKRSQQEKLWDIFATYALQLSCEDPTRMRVANVIKLLQDCGVIDSSESEEAKLIEKEVAIVCESFLKSHPGERDGAKKLNFTAFLALLLHFAKMSGDQDPNRAYDSLVRTCIERQIKPRLRVVLTEEIDECRKVLTAFEDPLTKIFAFYASVTLAKLENLEPKMAQLSPPHLGYAECVAFGRMYGIIALGMLTTTEFSMLYIDSLAKGPTTEYDRVLTYDGFCELLVRLSRKVVPAAASADHDGDEIPSDKRLKGLFQLMWLVCASNSPRALKITDVLKTDRVDVMQIFLVHFEKFWKKEHYENYIGLRGGSVNATELDDAARGSTPPRPSPSSPPRPTMTRKLSLCVQPSSALSANDGAGHSGGATSPTAKKSPLQRRFTMSSPSPSPSSSPTKLKQQQHSSSPTKKTTATATTDTAKTALPTSSLSLSLPAASVASDDKAHAS
ncbi:hypothetical protein PybrP1_008531 [[Pythium] brassicae (nom. inval.)]|nr:hypothetical protein PybrP1_008531 [[Pythium] brassicae (nom. inval.)]